MGLVPLGEVYVIILGALGTGLESQIRTHAKVVKLLVIVEINDVVFFVSTHRFSAIFDATNIETFSGKFKAILFSFSCCCAIWLRQAGLPGWCIARKTCIA